MIPTLFLRPVFSRSRTLPGLVPGLIAIAANAFVPGAFAAEAPLTPEAAAVATVGHNG